LGVQLADNKNFNQIVYYDVDKLINNFQKCVYNLKRINSFEFLSGVNEFMKAFSLLSSVLSMGFSDITEKVKIWRDLFINEYKDDSYNDLQFLMTKEIELKIHKLNGENNS
jgi:hypothetical protein